MTHQIENYIAYYRVSTPKQGETKLGLEAQREGVIRHMGKQPLLEFTDIQSGSRTRLHKRSEVFRAIAECKATGYPLVVYKLDRLARDVQFLSQCQNGGVKLIACDFPALSGDSATNTLALTIMMAMAEYESNRGSIRTRDAMRVLKSKGRKLGNPRTFAKAEYIAGGLATAKKFFTDEKRAAFMIARDYKVNHGYGASEIAEKLTELGHPGYDRIKVYRLLSLGTRIENHEKQLKRA